jgi:hypothetical protein
MDYILGYCLRYNYLDENKFGVYYFLLYIHIALCKLGLRHISAILHQMPLSARLQQKNSRI